LESDLNGILYFQDKAQVLVSETSSVIVYFKPSRIGIQEKYFQVITKTGEVDVKVKAVVEPVPQL